MEDIPIEQALYANDSAGGYRLLARSGGFADDWLPEAQRVCADFGERPAGVHCPACVFAQPFANRHVAVVQVADQGTGDIGPLAALGFRLLIVPRNAYVKLMGDPFAVAERFPPPWHHRGDLPTLSWSFGPLPRRTVADVRNVLKSAEGPALLGGVQALVDGGRLVFQRPEPDTSILQALWTLLPTTTRGELWPASFAFSNGLGFDALVAPQVDGESFTGYLREEQAGDYPQGRYELHLQIAAEAGDQEELDALFARRSRAQTWRLGWILLAVMLALALLMGLLNRGP